jgi:hypothetical protein
MRRRSSTAAGGAAATPGTPLEALLDAADQARLAETQQGPPAPAAAAAGDGPPARGGGGSGGAPRAPMPLRRRSTGSRGPGRTLTEAALDATLGLLG